MPSFFHNVLKALLYLHKSCNHLLKMKNKNMQCTFTLHDSSLKHQHNNSGSEFAPVGASSVLQRNLKEGLTVDSFSSVVL